MARLKFALLFSLVLATGQAASEAENIDMATSRNIRRNLNHNVAPCSNFWHYACGNWARRGQRFIDNFQQVETTYARSMDAFLSAKKPNALEHAPHLLQQLRDYYGTCIRLGSSGPKMERYIQEFPAELQVPRELFTTGSADADASFEWTRVTADLRRYGLNGVYFDETVDVAYNDSLQPVVQLKMPPQDVYFRNKHQLLDLMFEFGLIEYIDAVSEQLTQQIYALELQLGNLSKEHRSEEPTVLAWSLSELKQQVPEIDWQTYFDVLLQTKHASAKLRIEVSDVAYLRALGALLQRTSKRILNLYLRMRLFSFLQQARPRQLTVSGCVHHMHALLPLGMNYAYDRHIYKTRAEDTRRLEQIFSDLRATFAKYVQANRLQLTQQQLRYVHAKLDAMHLRLGNLPKLTADAFYDEHYASANFTAEDFFRNHWQALHLRMRLQHTLLESNATVQLDQYYVNDDVFKARSAPYFEHERNTLTVPLNFLQLPFFDHQQHSIFQYSLVGFILAHELTHAFEQEGILFDAAGNETPMGLEIRGQRQFKDAMNCAKRIPTVSLKERLADLNGLQLTYDAFFGIGHDSKQFEYLPYAFEPDYRAPQLFYLNFAQFFCGKLPPPIGHDADDVRVNVAVANMQQFPSDFNCTRNEAESKLVTCEMWRPAE